MNIVYYESGGSVNQAAKRIGILREWLNKLKSKFEKSGKNPKALEPKLKTPRNTHNRQRVSNEAEDCYYRNQR